MKIQSRLSLFRTADGRNHVVTFALVSSLFLLWGFCNGMIDVMDKHFQNELHLNLAQSAWVQFAHYLGYFLMALPAGWLAMKLGYRGGIISGLLMVALGGLWFIPATHIAQFWAFLLGVCFIAAGLTFLETVANPYTTVLGAPEYGPTRINLAQSCNGIGWLLGPIAGSLFFYSTDATGQSTGAETLWIPYAAVAVVVIVLAVVFAKAPMPDIKAADVYQPAAGGADGQASASGHGQRRGFSLLLLWLNLAVLSLAIGMIATAIATIFSDNLFTPVLVWTTLAMLVILSATVFIRSARRLRGDSIWSHPHFSSSTLAQFFYMAAQAGIFAYFINYMTREAPVTISDATASTLASVGFGCFLVGRVTGAALVKKYSAHTVLGVYGAANILCCAVVMLRAGWVSTIAVFASYFFMSIMFPTIFALGIFGLGDRSKRAASFLVMAIMGGAIVPKLMGHIADRTSVSLSFIVPLLCFGVVAAYGFAWKNLVGAPVVADSDPR
ncbi:MAG: MFS transporter [Verrucomicrobiales bacterium]|jgi:FHS family L-fucose permease-like MFS transporter|nr:MFS transporter [Verrucomicrobiales bacterium]